MGTSAAHLLLGLAASVAVVHTTIGIDHALPFVVLSRVQNWSLKRTLVITVLCGVGHIASAVVLGAIALGLGVAVQRLGPLEAVRGKLGLGILIVFGLGYALLGAVRVWKNKPHRHFHAHGDGSTHEHDHHHHDEHVHVHADAEAQRKKVVSTWTLFVVLVFGPCEALVPLLLAPGVSHDFSLLAAVIVVFGTLTVLTMLVLVTLGVLGTRLINFEKLAGPRFSGYSDVLAGLAISATGVAVGAFGL